MNSDVSVGLHEYNAPIVLSIPSTSLTEYPKRFLIVINKQVEQPLKEHTYSDSRRASLGNRNASIVRGRRLSGARFEDCMEKGSTLEEGKNMRLHGLFDYHFERGRIFDLNRWKQSVYLHVGQRLVRRLEALELSHSESKAFKN